MKKTILIGATLAIVGLASAPLFAQTQSTTTTSTSGYIQSSSVIGSKIKDSRGQDVGEIKDFVLDRNSGCLAYVVLSTRGGGTTTTATKTVAAPWSVFSPSSETRVYTTRIERERLYSAPVWESTRYEEYSRPEYINSVYGYYGVTPLQLGVTTRRPPVPRLHYTSARPCPARQRLYVPPALEQIRPRRPPIHGADRGADKPSPFFR